MTEPALFGMLAACLLVFVVLAPITSWLSRNNRAVSAPSPSLGENDSPLFARALADILAGVTITLLVVGLDRLLSFLRAQPPISNGSVEFLEELISITLYINLLFVLIAVLLGILSLAARRALRVHALEISDALAKLLPAFWKSRTTPDRAFLHAFIWDIVLVLALALGTVVLALRGISPYFTLPLASLSIGLVIVVRLLRSQSPLQR
jgi:hypothetical protein